MGTNKRQRAIREYAAQHGLSYTKAMRALDETREASAAATLPNDPHSGYAVVFTTEHDTFQEWEHAVSAALRPFAGTPEHAMPCPRLVIVGPVPAWSSELGLDMDAESTTHLSDHSDGVTLVNQIVAARLERPADRTEPFVVILPRHGSSFPAGTAAAWARRVRQARMSVIGFEDGVNSTDRPASFIADTVTQSGEDLMDALDRVGRSRGVSTIWVSAAAPTSLGHPQHLTRMVYRGDDDADHALEFNPCDNVLLAGGCGSGATYLSLPIMAHLCEAGYRVLRVDPKHPEEYPHVLGVTYTPKGEPEALKAIADMEPGTADRPAALVLDHAYALLLELRHSEDGQQQAGAQNLRRLMLDPHTAVIVRDERPSETTAPWPGFHTLLGVRVLMGKAPSITGRIVLGDAPEVPVPEGRGAGVMLSSLGGLPQVIHPRPTPRR